MLHGVSKKANSDMEQCIVVLFLQQWLSFRATMLRHMNIACVGIHFTDLVMLVQEIMLENRKPVVI